MCLAIPGQIIALEDAVNHLATVDVAGVRRRINVGLIDDAQAGDWVLIHVGFAMSRIDEEEAERTLSFIKLMGDVWDDEKAQFSQEAPL